MKKNDSEWYRSDLSHSVVKLGAALRSLDRMGKVVFKHRIESVFHQLEAELKEIRKIEREVK